MPAPIRPTGFPAPQGLYDPAEERDACGLGFVAHVKGVASREIVEKGLRLLVNLSHRGAAGSDPESGDGAGILLQIPHALLARECAALGLPLPGAGEYGVGMLFLPRDAGERTAAERAVQEAVAAEGGRLLGWRDVPVAEDHLGDMARRSLPRIRQCFLARGGLDPDAFERQLFRVRKRAEKAFSTSLRDPGSAYVVSLSSRTIVYKGLLLPSQLPRAFTDLANPETRSAVALVHSRFSTNTFPTWSLAHPFRLLAHNGEINALRGNLKWMKVREAGLASELLGDDARALFPIVSEGQSDSACLDNALEFLALGGRPLPHAAMMLIPEAWQGNPGMDPGVRAFYEFHSALMEPWDGPAAVAFSDGRLVGAVLDRNGLRPARYVVTHDDLVVLASEAGTLRIDPAAIRAKGKLGPGQMLVVDTAEGRIWSDGELKAWVASRRPFAEWVARERVNLEEMHVAAVAPPEERTSLLERQHAFGYTEEESRVVLAPMATTGGEPLGSMGTDTPLAVLSDRPQLLFKYFRQQFAQVTNPPIDPIREELVMSLAIHLGPRSNLLVESPAYARRVRLEQPVLDDADVAKLRLLDQPFRARVLSTLFPAGGDAEAMERALDDLCAAAAAAVREGCGIVILSDRGVDARSAPIPSLLASAAVHHHLIREGLRRRTGLVVETGEAREVTHFALLIGFGAEAVNPYLVWETLEQLARRGDLGDPDAQAARVRFTRAVGKGLLKILSKMGISTLQSYCGAQLFEAVGIGRELIDRHFSGTTSRIGGLGLAEVAEETLRRHRSAFEPALPLLRLDAGSEYHYRSQGEHHNWAPMAIVSLQRATRGGDYATFREFSRIADEEQSRFNLRGLLEPVAGEPVPLEEVEPAAEIVKRFTTGAMSLGALGPEAHETLAIAMNRIGGRSNSGEGGEDAGRFRGERNSAIKQIASGRFGVTTEYLVHAAELQIKMAQGAKPGEGGQLPGHKVNAMIAKTRHSTPGVTLISPPPHHDIYSIEDLAQLIRDLKTVNPEALISVKLVARAGVGTVAAGVAKAHADLIVISGDSGGTGASPLSSIKHAGIPWEMGIAEVQQTLVLNHLRGRVRLQTDGQMRTGRDVVVAALLGAEEFGFSTAPLVAEGCVMMRKCHLNTCPVGITTQDPVLRAKFSGKPEHVINYFFFVAEEVRERMAEMGFRSMDEMIGRSDRLRARQVDHWKGRTLDLSPLLHRPELPDSFPLRQVEAQDHGLDESLDYELIRLAAPALDERRPVSVHLPIWSTHRTVGAMLAGEIARRYGQEGLPDDTVQLRFTGAAGQSFGAFAVAGMSLTLEGEANDYVGKGLSGGRIVVQPSRAATFAPEETILLGNAVLYGATAGEAYFRGIAGERFAVRNSGASAVVEGVGDHGCEYMTGGVVVVLGSTGRNFGAGMSGGTAFVLGELGQFEPRCNLELVEVERVADPADLELLRDMLERHARFTGSSQARQALGRWDEASRRFVKVIPTEYRRITVLSTSRAEGKELAAHG